MHRLSRRGIIAGNTTYTPVTATHNNTSETTNAFGGAMSAEIVFPVAVPVTLKSMQFKPSRTGTYSLTIDGVQVTPPKSISQDAFREMLDAPYEWENKKTLIKWQKHTGSAGWYYSSSGSHIQSWLSMNRWIEAGGGETVPISVSYDIPSYLKNYQPSNSTSGSSYSSRQFDIMPKVDMKIHAIRIGHSTESNLQFYIDGDLVSMAGAGGWCVCSSPVYLQANTTYNFNITGGSTTVYYGSGNVSDSLFNIYAWTEQPSNSLRPRIHYQLV